MEDIVVIPYAKTYHIRPLEWKKITLLWKVRITGQCTAVNATNIKSIIASYSMGQSGLIIITLYNSNNTVAILAPRTIALRIFEVKKLKINKLPSEVDYINNIKDVLNEERESLRNKLYREFDTVFDLSNHLIILDMHKLIVRPFEIPCVNTQIEGGQRTSFYVDKLASYNEIMNIIEKYKKKGYLKEIRIEESVFLSPILPIRKPDRGVRITNDHRSLNAYFFIEGAIQIDCQRVIQQVPEDWKIYSIIDLKDGFFAIPIHSSLQHYFAFQY